jgi:microcystin-dependent protein
MAEPFIGQVMIFAGNFAPRNWAYCDGTLLQISQNQALFSLLGTNYGGDGRVTFALPDLRGRVPLAPGTGPGLANYRLGQEGGVEDVTLNSTQMPSHSHTATATTTTTIMAEGSPGTVSDPTGNILASGTNIFRPNSRAEDVAMDPDMVSAETTVNVSATGGGQVHENRQPYLAINYIIALQGIYPSRS